MLILVRKLVHISKEMIPRSRKFIRFSENIFRVYATILLFLWIQLNIILNLFPCSCRAEPVVLILQNMPNLMA